MAVFFKHLFWRLEVLAYDFIRLLMIPFSLAQVSSFSGRVIGFIGPKTSKHHIARTNMKLAFPDADDTQIDAWLKESWNHMGRTFGEFPLLGRIKTFDKTCHVKVVGLEILEKLKEDKKSAVLISGHFANWEFMVAVLSQTKLPVMAIYRPTNNPYFDKRIRAQRTAYGIKLMVAKSDPRVAKELIRALGVGNSVALMNDQKFNEGIKVPFFGHGAMTASGPTRLAMQTGAPLIPISIVRTSGTNFHITIHKEIKITRTGNSPEAKKADIRATVIKITEFIEHQIRANPTDWFWVHRRWPKEMYRKRSKE